MITKFKILTFCCFFWVTASAFALEVDVKEIHGMREVWTTLDGIYKKVGMVEVVPKGTNLYHWGKATPKQAADWNAQGRISPELLQRLKASGEGLAGGGFYVSSNFVDSNMYGNTLMVIEIPKDLMVMRLSPEVQLESDRWNILIEALERKGFSAVGNSNSDTWYNIVDAEALTKEYVATADSLKDVKTDRYFSEDDIKQFTVRHMEFDGMPELDRLSAESKKLSQIILQADETSVPWIHKIFSRGSFTLKQMLISNADYLPADSIFYREMLRQGLKADYLSRAKVLNIMNRRTAPFICEAVFL